jgi:hypothetical protein
MAMIAMLSAKAAPGVTTSVALLASVWPGPVLVADADPCGGDIVPGWLGAPFSTGDVCRDRGVSSFAAETRHLGEGTPEMLAGHLQALPEVVNGSLLAGLAGSAQAHQVDIADWCRLAESLSALNRERAGEVDVLVDCGRIGVDTPWPLLTMADLVLLAVRPQRRFLCAAREAVATLRVLIESHRLGLAICGATAGREVEVQRALGLRVGLQLPDDQPTARVFSDGTGRGGRLRRTSLVRSAGSEAQRLRRVLNVGVNGTCSRRGT